MQEQGDQEDVAIEGRDMKGVVTLGIGDEGIGAMLEEQVDCVVMTALGSPLQRCCDGLATFSIDLCAMLDQKFAHGKLVVDRGPLCSGSIVSFSSIPAANSYDTERGLYRRREGPNIRVEA